MPQSFRTFAVFVGELESLNESQCFVDRPSNRKIVHRHLAKNPFLVDDEQTSANKFLERNSTQVRRARECSPKCNAFVLFVNSERASDVSCLVSQNWKVDVTDSTCVSWSVRPGKE